MEFTLCQGIRIRKLRCKPTQKLHVLYERMPDDETNSLYVFHEGWQRLEPFLIFADLPPPRELHWRPHPSEFTVWKEEHIVTVHVGNRTLVLYMRNLASQLQRLYDVVVGEHLGEHNVVGDLYDHVSGQKLDRTQSLLDIYTHIFEIKFERV